ncbi:DUF4062 domain-containing protein [uncultured Methanoregula sp.]|uniref:DUF4062 domain-containing protein n=1 Tax=uncultured Methanoregula sp. TaxID=1005933 RepID=UPI002AAAB2F8|nr:DUF4062 domain-containing protein [uncultured Methanoregula sp.]
MDFGISMKKKQPSEDSEFDPCEKEEFVPRFRQKKINIFVSSTFKDMKAERDELTLQIFPALRKVCEERGIAWGEVDLRWGIPEEKRGEVLNTCLKFIDECRPYFIGMLGERYGWVEEDAPEWVIRDYPWIRDHKGKSITELEILHGVLNNPAMAGHVFFYFRDPAYIRTLPESLQADFLEGQIPEEIIKYGLNEAEQCAEKRRGLLAALKGTIRKTQLPVRENYRDPIQFGEFVKEDLMRVIDSISPPPKPLSEAERARTTLDREDMAHEAFAASRFGVYIPRQEYFEHLDAHVAGDSPPVVVLGKSGSGKSALLAHWAYRYRLSHPDDLVLVHFVGASPGSTGWTDMLRRFMGEFKRTFNLAEEIPAQDDALRAAFANWLSMAATHGRVVLVIDALNQLEDRNGAPDLVWLPPKIPGNIRLIVSTLEGRPLDAIRKRKWPTITVEPLTVSERKALITCYLKKYHKELSPSLKEELASAPQSEKPLFLRALLEEVRIHGIFEKLPGQIRAYLAAPTVDALYEQILTRYERDYERDRQDLVRDVSSLIWAGRRGLSRSELMDLLGTGGKPLPAAYWAPLYLAMEHSLVEKDGRITFFHDYLRSAVEHRYLPTIELKRAAHRRIADYFAIQTGGLRRIEELPWQLAEAAEWDRLVALLTDPAFFMAVWDIEEYDVKRYWVQTEAGSSHRMVETYQSIIREPSRVSFSFVFSLRGLLYVTGHLDEASALGEYLIQASKKHGDINVMQASFGNQAVILQTRGDLDGAMALHKEQERICRDLQNFNSLQASLGNQSNILQIRGDLDGAMALLKEVEQISRNLGNDDSLQRSLCNQALILKARRDHDGAMKLLKDQERICRELGDADSLQASFGNQASILQIRGDLDGAMKLLKDQERICRELGNIDSLQISLGNQASILQTHGDLDGSMALLKEVEQISRNLGNIDSLQASFGGQAGILMIRGDLDGAMVLLKEQERICRKLGNINSLQNSLGNQANIHQAHGDLDGAMVLLKEQERISRELGDVDSLQNSLGNQVLILQARGDLDGAMVLLKEKERISRKIGNIDSLQTSLGNQARILKTRGDLDGAMKLLKEQERICRELGNTDSLQISLGNQAIILQLRGDLDRAMALHKEEERICRELGNTDSLQRSLGNQAIILQARGDLNGAMALLREKERICREIGNVDGLQRSLGTQALVLSAQGDPEGALRLHKDEERICREIGNVDSLQKSLGHQANILRVRGDLDEAMVLLKEQENLCRKLGNYNALVKSLIFQAIILAEQDRHQQALSVAEEAYNLASHRGYTSLAKQILPIVEAIRKEK